MSEKTYIDTIIEKAKIAQEAYSSYTQKQVDVLVRAVGKVIYDNAEVLAKEAVAETGYGRVDSKILKQKKCTTAAWYYLKDKKSVGVIEHDTINDLLLIAKPLGVVVALIPTTNPTSTMASNGMSILKCRNSMIVSPHPRAKHVTRHGFDLINSELKRLGAPDNLIQFIDEVSLENTSEVMHKSDVIVATGGAGMIKAAYSSGRPSFGVGPGNNQVIVAPDYRDYDTLAKNILSSRAYDNGMACTSEQAVHVQKSQLKPILEAFCRNGATILPDEKLDDLQKMLFKENGATDASHVGMTAIEIANYLGVKVPENTMLLVFRGRSLTRENLLCREKMCPLVQYFCYDTLDEAIANAKRNLLWEGAGHTSVIYTNDPANAEKAGVILPVSRLLVNQPGAAASGGNYINGLAPTMSLGCGSWGNNSISENLTYRHLMNVTRVAFVHPCTLPPAEEVWAE